MTWIKQTPCIEWQGYRDKDGYGRKRANGKYDGVHRIAWIEKYGEIPDGLYVLHHCDNPACYNTDHLFIGTQRDNTLDAVSKGRWKGGPKVERLSSQVINQIRCLKAENETIKAISTITGVNIHTVKNILYSSHNHYRNI